MTCPNFYAYSKQGKEQDRENFKIFRQEMQLSIFDNCTVTMLFAVAHIKDDVEQIMKKIKHALKEAQL